jgi:hypothetical protein
MEIGRKSSGLRIFIKKITTGKLLHNLNVPLTVLQQQSLGLFQMYGNCNMLLMKITCRINPYVQNM